jgi:hypothetical protein
MSKLTYQNGKFYREGKEVPPEFGNPEQIALLKKIQFQMENGVPVSVEIEEYSEYEIWCSFKCPKCFSENHFESSRFETWEPDRNDIKEFLEDEIDSCNHCDCEIEIKSTKLGYIAKVINNDEQE